MGVEDLVRAFLENLWEYFHMRWTKRERALIRELQKRRLSPSHALDHLARVASYALSLARTYGGKRDLLGAAALLHDLTRDDPHYRGAQSAKQAARESRAILERCGYLQDEIRLIAQCIAEHDQPMLRSRILEARILKDADYLDGFGARGILRSMMYAGETRGSVGEAVGRMRDKGRQRLAGLAFAESRRLGWRLHRLTETFLAELSLGQEWELVSYPGKFIVIEGISGSGKDVQAERLTAFLRKQGRRVLIVHHPTPLLKTMWRKWRTEVNDPLSELFLLLADRVRMVRGVVQPALESEKWVVSTRSQISAQVYQAVPGVSAALYRFFFSFEPVADVILYLDVLPREALRRTGERVAKGEERDRGFFGTTQEAQRRRYERILRHYPNMVRIDANPDIRTVEASIQEAFQKLGFLD